MSSARVPPPPRRRPSSAASINTLSSTRTWRLKSTAFTPAPATVSAVSAPAVSSASSTSSSDPSPSSPPPSSSPPTPSTVALQAAIRPAPTSSHSQDAMKRVLERDDLSVAASRAEQAKVKAKGRGAGGVVTSEFGGEGGGEEGMFLPNRRPQPAETSVSPSTSTLDQLKPSPTETDIPTTSARADSQQSSPSPAHAPAADPPVTGTDKVEAGTIKKRKLKHGARKEARPSTWFGWGGGQSSDAAQLPSSSPDPATHRRETSNPEPSPTEDGATPGVAPVPSAAAASLPPSTPTAATPPAESPSLADTAEAAALPAPTPRIPKIGGSLAKPGASASRGSWFRSAPPAAVSAQAAVVVPEEVARAPVAEAEPAPPTPDLTPSAASEVASARLSWLKKVTSSSTLRSPSPPPASRPQLPAEPPAPNEAATSVPTPSAALDLASLVPDGTVISSPPLPPATSSGWFRRPASATSLSSPSAPNPQALQAGPSPSAPSPMPSSPPSSIRSSSTGSVPIPRGTSLGSAPSAASSYGSTRPAIPSSLGREVVTAESSDTGGTESSGWWGYVPGLRGNGAVARKDIVSVVEEEPVAHENEPATGPADVVSPSPSAPAIAQSSILNPIAWVWPTSAPPPTPPVPAQAIAPPASLPQPSTEVPSSDVSPKDLVLAPPSAAAPTSYASWLSFIASKAVSPPTFAKPAADVVDGIEVMDIEDEPSTPQTPTSTVASVKSPAPSIKTGKQQKQLAAKASSSTVGPQSSSSTSTPKPPSLPSSATSTKGVARSSSNATLKGPPPPNLVLPTFDDIFRRPPRSTPPPPGRSLARKTLSVFNTYVLPTAIAPALPTAQETRLEAARRRGNELPKTWLVANGPPPQPQAAGTRRDGSPSARRIVVISLNGWFPNAIVRYIAGEPTGTSVAFATKMDTAIRRYLAETGGESELEKLTVIPLEGQGKIEDRVDRSFKDYLSRPEWVDDLRCADAVFIATHSQGCPVSTHLLNRLYDQGHLQSPLNEEAVHRLEFAFGPPSAPRKKNASSPRVVMLAICGVHAGPLAYLNASSVVMPYLQYFENAAAHELFEFQDTESVVSRAYTSSLSKVLDHGVKMVYVASLNDQVVPVYGAIFSPVSHPNILRVLHIDGEAYSASDFVTNLLVFCIQLRNAGLSDGGMVAHLSEVVASGLTGVGHSTAYKEDQSYTLAARVLFESTPSTAAPGSLEVDEFLATEARNDYDIPWIMRGILEDVNVLELFGAELDKLRAGFDAWQPVTPKMKDLRKKLEPLRPRQSRRTPASQPVTAVTMLSPAEGGLAANARLGSDW